jgi:hypothetical protein
MNVPQTRTALPWIEVAPKAPYFVTDTGRPWTPIGQNDSIVWVELAGLFRRRDMASVANHLASLAGHGVTCLRLMLEYAAHSERRYLERPAGVFAPNMVRLWDDLFALCERFGLRMLLTPFDTFWTWRRFHRHPYNRANGGPLDHPARILLCPETRAAIKRRLSFAVERWGGSGALFAWDLWNEIHPAQAEGSADVFAEFIHDLSTHVRAAETRLYGRAHPQTVSLFGPELVWRPQMNLGEPIFRHPDLDFATLHIYETGTIDYPKNTVDAAVGMGRIVRDSLVEIRDGRPFLDTEHGPIHSFKDHRITWPEPYDDEYFRHMQWAHFAAGGAGGGMRWPNRHPHTLTRGMRRAQLTLSRFAALIDWARFDRQNRNDGIEVLRGDAAVPATAIARFACASRDQALVYLLRRDTLGADGMVRRDAAPARVGVALPDMEPGDYLATWCDTADGSFCELRARSGADAVLRLAPPPFVADIALAIRRG